MDQLVAFDAPLEGDDGHGGVETGWDVDNSVQCHAEFRYQRGGEGREAARPEQGAGVIKVRVRSSSATRAITPSWRLRDLRRGTVYNLREVDAETDRANVWIVAERGVAV